ncbi:prolyl oligopeptidase family serine peptidase [Leeuwenhoekiella marinoflava]|uniref:prolyl oligopeptidase n=2 Tax=Leeuwenhoekiella marinoflava TaxID=988 RepID=A0A4Q0PFU3_9FLAO|nr:prolyl oligopeptidase family serine peptidase [Leeuwenhoekiella marinoflava]RXG25396.1 prolyl oligopeptidase [Leeuwenhoekiella marinoflava]SHF87940.1 prolyl oligopeptidase [Leeuwenhoekiella marinoflava DSM 3653]
MKYYTFLILGAFLFIKCSSSISQIGFNYPQIEPVIEIDTIFGKIISDPYRNLEDLKNKSVSSWYEKQTSLADSVLNNISNRSEILKKLLDYDGRVSASIRNIRPQEDGSFYYLKRDAGEDSFKLWYRESINGDEKMLFSPIDYNPDENQYTINYISPSWDEKHIAISLSHSGKELSSILILDTDTGEIAPEIIQNAWPSSFLGINWLPDSSGFIFLYFPVADADAEDFKKNTYSVLYKLKDPADKLRPIFGNKQNPELGISETGEFPIVSIKSQQDEFMLGYLATVENHWDAYIAPLTDLQKPKINWEPFYTKEDKVFTSKGQFRDSSFYYKTVNEASIYQLAEVLLNNPDFKNPKWITNHTQNENVEDFKTLKDYIVYSTTQNGVDAKLYKYITGKTPVRIELPKQSGSIELASINPQHNTIWVETSGWVSDYNRYNFNPENNLFTKENLADRASFPEFENIIAKEVLVTGHDGEEIPLSIIYSKNINLNDENPALLFGYGAYGSSINPFFSPTFLYWVEQGGVFCIPHVRGGGEKGDEWYEDGKMLNKENTWKDLISATQYLIDEGYTSKEKTAVYSMSAGAIMVGRAVTERPDLFKAVVAEVGILNPLRNEAKTDKGGSNVSEFGSIKDSIQFPGLVKMDPYLNLKQNTDYPAMLITGGDNDPRVPIWMPGKFAALAQDYNLSNNPILLKINYDAGHGDFDETERFYQDYVDLFSFCFWQTGSPRFQLKNKLQIE